MYYLQTRCDIILSLDKFILTLQPGQHSTGPLGYHLWHSATPSVNFRNLKKKINFKILQKENIKIITYLQYSFQCYILLKKKKRQFSTEFNSKITLINVFTEVKESIYPNYHCKISNLSASYTLKLSDLQKLLITQRKRKLTSSISVFTLNSISFIFFVLRVFALE